MLNQTQSPYYNLNTIAPIKPLYELAELAKAEKDDSVRKYLMAISLTNDTKLARDFCKVMQLKAAYELLQGVPFSEPETDFRRLLNQCRFVLLGKIRNTSKPFLYPLDLLNQHALILGGSGTGKTTLLYAIALQAMRQNIPVWMVDKDKQDYRHLKRLAQNVFVFDIQKNVPFNPLQIPEGISPEHWIAVFSTVFTKSNSLLDGSESLLLKALYKIYEEFGVLDGSDTYPTLHDLYEKLVSYTMRGNSRSAGYRDSLVNRLEAYLSINGTMFNYSKGLPIQELAKHSLVLEIKGLTERIARFMINMLLHGLFHYRIASGERGNALRNLVLVDEAKYLIPAGYNENLGFSPLTSVMAQAREVGMGMLFADQSAQLEDTVFVNSRLKMCFRLGDGQDIEKARRAMSLSKEQAAYIPKLQTGECIVRIPGEDPFLIETPTVNLQ